MAHHVADEDPYTVVFFNRDNRLEAIRCSESGLPHRLDWSTHGKSQLSGMFFPEVSASISHETVRICIARLSAIRVEKASVFGCPPPDKGEVRVQDKPVRIRRARDAMDAGIALAPPGQDN
jgi:hypothetical protein